MKIFVENSHSTLRFCLNILRWTGFLVPDEFTGIMKKIHPLYSFFWFMFVVGIFDIVQFIYLIKVWGDLSEMTNAAFLLFTNISLTIKIVNVILKKNIIQEIIDEAEEVMRNETREEGRKIVISAGMDNRKLIYFYAFVVLITIIGMALGVEKDKLPFRSWYPYDTTKSPAFEISYAHQAMALFCIPVVNISLDQLLTSLVSICRARLRLVNLSLRTLTQGLDITEALLDSDQENLFSERLRSCVEHHQAALESAVRIQYCFSKPTLVQFTVTLITICTSAFQLLVEDDSNVVRLVSMTTYLMCMIIQVFIYCYQGNLLTVEAFEVANAAYECPWYLCSVPIRRALLMMMIRTSNILVLTAGGFTTLSLDSFMSIIKASYSFFTILKRMEQ